MGNHIPPCFAASNTELLRRGLTRGIERRSLLQCGIRTSTAMFQVRIRVPT